MSTPVIVTFVEGGAVQEVFKSEKINHRTINIDNLEYGECPLCRTELPDYENRNDYCPVCDIDWTDQWVTIFNLLVERINEKQRS